MAIGAQQLPVTVERIERALLHKPIVDSSNSRRDRKIDRRSIAGRRVIHNMTQRKKDNTLLGDRTPAYVGRETGAAELQISPDTWDQWVKEGRLPPPCDTFPTGTPRWRWEDVDRKLSGRMPSDTTEAGMRGALNFGKKKGSRLAVA